MKFKTISSLLLLLHCMSQDTQSQDFTGTFAGKQPGINSAAILKSEGNLLGGNFELNGRPGNITANINGDMCQGTVYDIQMQKTYSFSGRISPDSLHMSIIFPELNNRSIDLAMKRISAAPKAVPGNLPGEKNIALVGLWRYTETFSSGSGDSYASFSTDYFMEFKGDGTVYSWKGKSAGGMGDISLESTAGAAQKGTWYTEGKTLFLTDPATGSKSSVLFYAETNRLMLHNGGKEQKLMSRVK